MMFIWDFFDSSITFYLRIILSTGLFCCLFLKSQAEKMKCLIRTAEAMKKSFLHIDANETQREEGGKQEKINIYNANGSHKKGFSSLTKKRIALKIEGNFSNFASFIAEIKL